MRSAGRRRRVIWVALVTIGAEGERLPSYLSSGGGRPPGWLSAPAGLVSTPHPRSASPPSRPLSFYRSLTCAAVGTTTPHTTTSATSATSATTTPATSATGAGEAPGAGGGLPEVVPGLRQSQAEAVFRRLDRRRRGWLDQDDLVAGLELLGEGGVGGGWGRGGGRAAGRRGGTVLVLA